MLSTDALGRRPHAAGSVPVSSFWRSTRRFRPAASGSERSSQEAGSVPESEQTSRRSVDSWLSAGAVAQPSGSVPAEHRLQGLGGLGGSPDSWLSAGAVAQPYGSVPAGWQ